MTRKRNYGQGLAALGLLALLAGPVWAEQIEFNGEAGKLQNGPVNLEPGQHEITDFLAPSSSSGNSVTVNSGTARNVLGGYTITGGAASGNSVLIKGGTIGHTDLLSAGNPPAIIGGKALSISAAGADASNNSVIINGGTITGEVMGGWASGTGPLTATGNSVTINGGTVEGPVRAGYAWDASSASSTVTGNKLVITGGTVNAASYEITGGYSYSGTGAAAAAGNSVAVSGGTVTAKNVLAGYVETVSGAAAATGNSVFLSSGTVSGYVVGGAIYTGSGVATATGNSVSISKLAGQSLNLDTTTIAGGLALGSPATGSDVFAGNSLNVRNTSGETLKVKALQSFAQYNLVVPSSHPQSVPVITASGDVYLDDSAQGAQGRSATLTASTVDGAPLTPGSTVTLIQAGTLHAAGFTQQQVQGKHGATLLYTWDLSTNGTTIGGTLARVSVNPQTKALSEGFLSGLALSLQGADLAAGQGMHNAVNAARGDFGFGTFGALSGGWSRYNTGSHVDMSSVSMLAGLSFGSNLPVGRLTLGAFFEYGNGSYGTHNSFNNAASVDGDGFAYYLGGGILGRMDFLNTGPGHFYAEASGRMGGIYNSYETSDLRDALGRSADGYETASPYYGLHLGAGYIWDITEKISLDLYGKYFWTRQQGDSLTLATGDPMKFKDVDSHRLRGGGRVSYAVNEQISPYIGAAYEHEFDGKARATTYGQYDVGAPDLVGGTGIGELGLSLKPSQDVALSFDLGVQGYVGKREGVTGSLQVKFEF